MYQISRILVINTHFTGIKIKPKVSCWPEDVLASTLNSKTIQKIIKKDAKNGKDTFITFGSENDFPFQVSVLKVNDEIKIKGFASAGNWQGTYDCLAPEIRKLDIKENLATTIQKLEKRFGKIME